MKQKILKLAPGSYQKFDKVQPETPSKKTDDKQFWQLLDGAFELGFAVSLPVLSGIFLGQYLDRLWHSAPKMTLSGVFLGLAAGIYSLVRYIKKSQ